MKIAPYLLAGVAAISFASTAAVPAAQAQAVIKGPPNIVYDQRNDPAYNEKLKDYKADRETYLIQQDKYRQDRDAYLATRADYDARFGPGAYDRYRTDWYRPYATSPCERGSRANRTTGGVIGALAGAAIGSNVAARNARTEGAVLGALVGGALGASFGGSVARCDSAGYYYTADQTYPYREWGYSGRSGRYDGRYYSTRRCRLAVAPAYWDGVADYRYVRVCPDRTGRYRFTG